MRSVNQWQFVQSLSYAGHSLVDVLRTAPAPDEALAKGNRSIAVHGADGGLAFGPTLDKRDRQTVFDATFYRPVNTSFTGDASIRAFPSDVHSGTSQGNEDFWKSLQGKADTDERASLFKLSSGQQIAWKGCD